MMISKKLRNVSELKVSRATMIHIKRKLRALEHDIKTEINKLTIASTETENNKKNSATNEWLSVHDNYKRLRKIVSAVAIKNRQHENIDELVSDVVLYMIKHDWISKCDMESNAVYKFISIKTKQAIMDMSRHNSSINRTSNKGYTYTVYKNESAENRVIYKQMINRVVDLAIMAGISGTREEVLCAISEKAMMSLMRPYSRLLYKAEYKRLKREYTGI